MEELVEKSFEVDQGQLHIIQQLTGIQEPEKAIEHFVKVCIENFIVPERVVASLISDYRLDNQVYDEGEVQ
jgi:hypothetical protein